MIDEYQDTNRIQADILKLLSSNENSVTVVGDDAQSIYGFRAATVENILSFKSSFKAKIISLQYNYRSTPEIVDLSNSIIKNNRNQIQKTIKSTKTSFKKPVFSLVKTQNEEAEYIIENIKNLIAEGKKRSEISVLFRATRQAAGLEVLLKKEKLPYLLVGGEDFFGLEHIKLVLDMCRLLVSPNDSIALGSVQEILGFSSPILISSIENQAEHEQKAFIDILHNANAFSRKFNSDDYDSLKSFYVGLEELRSKNANESNITPVIAETIETLSPNLESRYRNLWENINSDFEILLNISNQYTSILDFVNTVALQQFVNADEQNEDKITLSTIHSAKGLEWEFVFIIGLVEFWFPLNFAIQQSGNDEEERRLFYVATTRAKNELYLTSYSSAMNKYGNWKDQQISRFINELPSDVYHTVPT